MTPQEQEGFLPEMEEDYCSSPCHPDNACPSCIDYWARMIAEGFWDESRKQWTDRGWSEIIRSAKP